MEATAAVERAMRFIAETGTGEACGREVREAHRLFTVNAADGHVRRLAAELQL